MKLRAIVIYAIALFGIPAAALGAILFDLQWSRLIYGQASPILLAFETGSLLTLLGLFLLLRWQLAQPAAPSGIVRNMFDFLALAGWHPAVKTALVLLLVVPFGFFLLSTRWMFVMLHSLGTRALEMTDIQAALDGGAVLYQHALVGGLPLLFALHLLSRWKRTPRLVPWLVLPVFCLGAAVAMVLILATVHVEN